MPLIREERWGRFTYLRSADRFFAHARTAIEGPRAEHPLSVSCRVDGEADLDFWAAVLRRLRSWGVMRVHVMGGERLGRKVFQWFLDRAAELGLQVVFSVETVMADLDLRVPSGTMVHVRVDSRSLHPSQEILGRCVQCGIEVRIFTPLEPLGSLLELGRQLAFREVSRWTIAPPLSSPERQWIGPASGEIPYEVHCARQDLPFLTIEYADTMVRESSLIVLSDGSLLTQDPLGTEPVWLGRFLEMQVQDLIECRPFDIDRHLDLWVEWPQGMMDSGRPERLQKFDVFISYNRDDWSEVREIVERIKKVGLRPWVDKWNIRPGVLWPKVIPEVLDRAPTMTVFLGESFTGMQSAELHRYLRIGGRPIIPTILKSVKGKPDLPFLLQEHSYVDLRENEPDPFDELIFGITGSKSSL